MTKQKSTDFIVQTIPIWAAVPKAVQRKITKQGKLAHQPVKLHHKKGCTAGGGVCFSCKIIPCGGKTPCPQCTVINCPFTPPCFGGAEGEEDID